MAETRGPLDPMDAGAFRWAWDRTNEHLRAHPVLGGVFIPGAALVIGALLPLSTHPTAGDRLLQGLIAVVLAYLSVGAGTFVYALVRAPYEQRNALRNKLREKAAKPEVEVQPIDYLKFSITNHGPTDHFQVVLGRPKAGQIQPWTFSIKERVTEKLLVSGAHAVIQCYDQSGQRPNEVLLTVLSRNSAPLEMRFTARYTQLEVHEMKHVGEEWPERDAAWRAAVQWLLNQLLPLRARLAAIPPDDRQAAIQLVGEFQTACRVDPVVVGHPFMYGRFNDTPKELKADDAAGHVAHCRKVFDRSIRDLEESLARGTDVV